MKKTIILITITMSLCFLLGFNKPESQLPNIVWLNIEGLSPHLNCYGDSTVSTPNIDQLAKEGIRYTKVFLYGRGLCPKPKCYRYGLYSDKHGWT